MDNRKEEILAKSRQAQEDEGIEYAIAEGAKKANNYAIEVVCMVLFVFSVITGQWPVATALATVAFAASAGEFIAKYRVLSQKRYLMAAICFTLFGIATAIAHVIYVGIAQDWWC